LSVEEAIEQLAPPRKKPAPRTRTPRSRKPPAEAAPAEPEAAVAAAPAEESAPAAAEAPAALHVPDAPPPAEADETAEVPADRPGEQSTPEPAASAGAALLDGVAAPPWPATMGQPEASAEAPAAEPRLVDVRPADARPRRLEQPERDRAERGDRPAEQPPRDRLERRGDRGSRRERLPRPDGSERSAQDRPGGNGIERPFPERREKPSRGQGQPQPAGQAQTGGHQGQVRQRPGQERAGQGPSRNGGAPHLTVTELDAKTPEELFELARSFELQGYTRLSRPELQIRILRAQTEKDGNTFGDGILEIIEDGFGFLRGPRFLPGPDDIYVSQSQIRRFGLRTGDRVSGQVRPPKDNEKFFSLLRVEVVNGVDPDTARRRPGFDGLTPIFPLELIDLETQPQILSTRLLNLVAPIGRGQRGLIVSPPKAGKTMLLKAIANGITANSPDMHLMVCLIGERPEEVTDMRRSIEGEVISSTFDEPVEDHTKVAEMALERAKRLVEGGRDVTILLDSITRLARAYNLAVPPSGRTLSGGIDPVALYPPKRFFGAARNIEGGGSLTVVATCLIDTGSRMDDVIYEEFKGTGNMELHLDRKLAERRIYPAIDVQRSGTRREELLLDENTLRQVWTMRRMVSMLGGSEGTELLVGRLAKTQTNEEFLETLTKDI